MLRDTPPTEGASDDTLWVRMARDAWESSKTWFDSSLRTQFEEAMAHFHSKHAPGSKYHTKAYEKKSKFFRPKTRAAIRRGEMGMAIALFSTSDAVHCGALNKSNERQVLAAELKNHLLNTRLADPKMFWFLTAIAGAQEAMNIGCVISHQTWKYRKRQRLTDLIEANQEGGADITQGGEEILEDRPGIDLVPVENLRISQAADWKDPINSSPFLIHLMPMYVWEIQDKANKGEYAPIDDPILKASLDNDWDSVRKLRQGDRIDRYQNDSARINQYRTVWVHKNIIRLNGYDFCYDTLGPDLLLSPPQLLEEVYLHARRERPYVMGFSVIEANRIYPSGIPHLTFSTQEYTNDIGNLRQDNVRLTLNKRYWVRRGSQTDVRSLIRNVAGGVTMMSNIERDVKETSTPDVTRSSYEEQDRLNSDFDDIAGSFSQGSVNTNRNLNETVGGMKLLHGGADQMQEYMIRTIVETWVEPVLRQVLTMEEVYESDLEFLGQVGGSYRLKPKDVLALLREPTELRVDAGFGATNPEKRIEKIHLGLGTLAKFFPMTVQNADQKAVSDEVFGALGFRDGSRFLPQLYESEQDPQVQQLMNENAMLKQMIEGKQLELQSRENVARIAAEARVISDRIKQETELMKQQAGGQIEKVRLALQARLEDIEAQLDVAEEERERMSLALEREALSHSILQADRDFMLRLKESDENKELQEKKLMGTEAKNLKGKDSAGVISRGDYGAIPDSPH